MMRSLYMREHVGERFEAIISDVAPFGFFVSVTHPYVEGLVPISSLGDDFYEFDERRARLVGSRTRRSYQVGDTIEVLCVAVDVREGRITFELVNAPGLRSKGRRSRPDSARRSGPKRRRR
jgi:ribonuclease R